MVDEDNCKNLPLRGRDGRKNVLFIYLVLPAVRLRIILHNTPITQAKGI